MSTNVTLNGTTYAIPAVGDSTWGTVLSNYFIAISTSVLQKTGGTFTLTADVDFGASYGLKAAYLKSRATNPSSTGIMRLGNTELLSWRNAANNADLGLTVNASDQLTYNGVVLASTSGPSFQDSLFNVFDNSDPTKKIALQASGITTGTTRTITMPDSDVDLGNIVNANISASAAIAYSKLNLSGAIVNADIGAAAAIAYSKLSLTGSIVNADIGVAAAIAYSKLNLTTSIVDGDIGAAAAIAYSKLAALTASRALVSSAGGVVSVSTVTDTELAYVSGVTSAIQTQLNAKAPAASPTFSGTITTPLTASRALATGASSELAASATTATELGYLSGVTSAVQTQLNAKAPSASPTLTTPTLDVAIWDDQGSTPANPSAGYYKTYFKTDGNMYRLNSSGTENRIGGGALIVTGSRASPSAIVAGTGISYAPASGERQAWFIEGSGGHVDVTANPQIVAGTTVGQELVLIGRNNDQTVTLDDGTGLSLNGQAVLSADSVLNLFWDGSVWVETSRVRC